MNFALFSLSCYFGAPLSEAPPFLSVAPFFSLLMGIAILPQIVPHHWEHEGRRAMGIIVVALPVAFWLFQTQPKLLAEAMMEYLSFIMLVASLYVVTGGMVLKLPLLSHPWQRTFVLFLGAVLSSLIGTTGASMLLLRPFLRACPNTRRFPFRAVYFILLVSNVGGLLTPLGDPPLYLGFLGGVPFFWTLCLARPWLFGVLSLLLCFFMHERIATKNQPALNIERGGLSFQGWHNVLILGGILSVVLAPNFVVLPLGAVELLFALLMVISWFTTSKTLRAEASFSWVPLREVSIIFFGIFLTMPPSLQLFSTLAHKLPFHQPAHLFWASGLISSCLDNVPTYLTFAGLAASKVGASALTPGALLASGKLGENFLAAISIGSVVMGGLTYIGNGPNLMVRAIAADEGVVMPSFGGYFLRAAFLLSPLLLYVSLYFLAAAS